MLNLQIKATNYSIKIDKKALIKTFNSILFLELFVVVVLSTVVVGYLPVLRYLVLTLEDVFSNPEVASFVGF